MKLKTNTLLGLLCLFSILSCKAQEVPQIDWAELQKTKPWTATEQWEPVPEKITAGYFNQAPSDAIVLFEGKDLSQWHKPKYDYGVNMETVKAIIKVKSENQNIANLSNFQEFDKFKLEHQIKKGDLKISQYKQPDFYPLQINPLQPRNLCNGFFCNG